jgi:Fe-S-cluster-containing hydrogenase component 2
MTAHAAPMTSLEAAERESKVITMKVLITDDSLCIGCHLCEDVCSHAWYKEIDREKSSIQITGLGNAEWAMAVCTQCGECIEICPAGAISRDKAGVVRIDKKLCVGCLSCVSYCPHHTMYYHQDYVEPIKCIACGLCTKECPTGALSIEVLPG